MTTVTREYMIVRKTTKAIQLLGGEWLPLSQVTAEPMGEFVSYPSTGRYARPLPPVTAEKHRVTMPEWLVRAKHM